MATKTNDVVNNSIVDALEQLLQRSVIDPEFRTELLTNPKAFGISADTENLVLPTPVAKQDMSFVELINNDTDFVAQAYSTQCRCTCVSTLTWKCDGSTM